MLDELETTTEQHRKHLAAGLLRVRHEKLAVGSKPQKRLAKALLIKRH